MCQNFFTRSDQSIWHPHEMPKSTQSCPLLEEAALASEQHTTRLTSRYSRMSLSLMIRVISSPPSSTTEPSTLDLCRRSTWSRARRVCSVNPGWVSQRVHSQQGRGFVFGESAQDSVGFARLEGVFPTGRTAGQAWQMAFARAA